MTEVSSLVGADVYKAISPYITLETSPFYSIKSVGKVEGSKIRQGAKALVVIDRSLKKGIPDSAMARRFSVSGTTT